ncbi:M24 family metallopeptidase [Paenibacillus solisilvae]|uniref:M24 family metallopeptidase n=1 Tax=Paenibacillus solisilvae TaxID=2486751 RepID=A0ABW0VY50_9BACL
MQGIDKVLQEEILQRIARLQEQLQKHGAAAFLVTQHVDLYYLTGSMQAGFAFIPAHGDATFYVRRSIWRAGEETAVRVEPLTSLRAFRGLLERDYPEVFAEAGQSLVATEYDVLPVQTYSKLADILTAGGRCTMIDGSAFIRRVRMTKSPWEIGRIEAAAQVAAEALEEAAGRIREGMTELELMARIEYEIRIRGHIGVMRTRSYNMEVTTGMLGSGEAAAIPSAFDGPAGGLGLGPAAAQSASRKPIVRGEPILLDIGCCIDGYIIDQTRTAVIGGLSDELAEAYAQSEAIIRKTEQMLRPGAACDAIYAAALAQADQAGLSRHFMGYGADQVKFLGHGIGLELDEWPVLAKGFSDPLVPGMVLAVEPKFTFPGKGVVGIENTYLVTDTGPRALTRSPEGLIVLP